MRHTDPLSCHWPRPCIIIHIGQIYQYIAFDKFIRDHAGKVSGYAGVPLDFADFTNLYNSFPAAPGQSSLYVPGTTPIDKPVIVPSMCPVTLRHFHITPQQCGLGETRISVHAQKMILERFAVEQARKSCISEQRFMECES